MRLPAADRAARMAMVGRIGERRPVAMTVTGVARGVVMAGGETGLAGWRRAGDRNAAALVLDHLIKELRVARREAHAAMRGRAAERPGGVGAVNGVSAPEEDRIGHRGHVIFFRIMHALQAGRGIGAARGVITG